MQMDDIRSLKLCESGDISACVGNIYTEEICPTEAVGCEDAKAFP